MTDFHPNLERIKVLLAPANDKTTVYTPHPPLTSDELATWEAANGIVLPEAYRLFLLEIGNGGTMPGSYCDFEMFRLDTRAPDSGVHIPFPVTKAQFEQRLSQPQMDQPVLFPELSPYWEDGLPPGCLALGRYPSYDLLLLVVSGELHGMVWNDVNEGLPELNPQRQPFDFLTWFEDTLLDLYGLKGS